MSEEQTGWGGAKPGRGNRQYVSILDSDQSFRIKADENTEGAIQRIFVRKDGTQGSKWEIVKYDYTGLFKQAKIVNIDFGTRTFQMLNIIFKSLYVGQPDVIIQVFNGSEYASSFLKKIPNADVNLPLNISPYNFTDKEGRQQKGFSLKQDDDKILSYFTKENANETGFPQSDPTKSGSAYWKYFFSEVSDFLYRFYKENVESKMDISDNDLNEPENVPQANTAPPIINNDQYAPNVFSGPEEDEDDLPF